MLRAMMLALVMVAMPTLQGDAPTDFALRLEFGCAGPDAIDTFKGAYERLTSKGRRTAAVRISKELKEKLFGLVSDAHFFEMSAQVTGLGVCEPSYHYRLQVRSGGRTHVVTWDDCYSGEAGTDEGRRVRALAEGILEPFLAMRVVKRLPESDILCL